MSSSSNNKSAGAAAGGELEEKLDLSEECSAKIEQAKSMISTSPDQLNDALTLLGGFEKRCRVGNDLSSLIKICETSLELCYSCSNHESLINTLEVLSTKRSQKSAAIRSLVIKCLPWCLVSVDSNEPISVQNKKEEEERDTLVKKLRDITDGKIFLEAERARLTRALANIYEQEDNVIEAANILQEVHVETYGSLNKKEKIEFILEQMRLTLLKKDYIRAAIVSNKIRTSHLSEEGMESYKIKFYTLMSQYHIHDKDTLELAKDYYNIYKTTSILKDENKWKTILQLTILFLSLSPYGLEQQDLLHRINADVSAVEKLIPSIKSLLELVLKKEIINYPLDGQDELESLLPKSINVSVVIDDTDKTTTTSTMKDTSEEEDLTEYWHTLFHQRIIQHNIRIISLYYKRIHGKRLANLLNLSPSKLEVEISNMVSSSQVYAKIDRPSDIIRFIQPQTPDSILTEWSCDIDKLLHFVDSTTHLIHKENMLNNSASTSTPKQ